MLRLSNRVAQSEPATDRTKYLYEDVSPLGLRITPNGIRTWFCEVWLRPSATGDRGRSVRRSIGSVDKFSADMARTQATKIAGELLSGRDALAEARKERKESSAKAVNLAAAVEQYVKGKRRGKDGLPLKRRTVHDYLQMVVVGGSLFELADRPIVKLSALDIQSTYKKISKRSEHSAAAAMRVLRAVLNWHGVDVEDSPFSKATRGKDRIILKPTAGSPKPIPSERLHDWWAAATSRAGDPSSDGCRLMLLTGMRPGEVFGSSFSPGLMVGDVDLAAGRLSLKDTKNRSDHVILLSRQALEIVSAHCKDKPAGAKVFDVVSPKKALATINRIAGVPAHTSPHKLRHTFATVAEELVTQYALKRMLNHAQAGDVTASHYVGKSESQLRVAWQAVADFIDPNG